MFKDIEDALNYKKPILLIIQDECLDPQLDTILLPLIEESPRLDFFMLTRQTMILPPDVFIKTNVIYFSISGEEINQIILSHVLSLEWPHIASH